MRSGWEALKTEMADALSEAAMHQESAAVRAAEVAELQGRLAEATAQASGADKLADEHRQLAASHVSFIAEIEKQCASYSECGHLSSAMHFLITVDITSRCHFSLENDVGDTFKSWKLV